MGDRGFHTAHQQVWLEPVLAAMIRQFPFRILAFTPTTAASLSCHRLWPAQQLLIEQTKSRPRHSNDNGLVETKNGAVIRKHLGYGSIPAATLNSCNTSMSPTSIPISTTTAPALRPISKSMPKAVNDASMPLPDPAGNPVGLTQPRPVFTSWNLARCLTAHRRRPQRYRSRTTHAASQTQTL